MKKKIECGYAPMPNGKLNRTQVKLVASELRRIEHTHGGVKPALIVKEAKDPKSALHPFFTWDDGAAAERWRLHEAQELSRSVRFVQLGIPLAEQPVIRAFVSVKATDQEEDFEGFAYISIDRVLENEHYRQQMLDSAAEDMRIFRRKYEDILMVTNSITAVDTVRSKLAKAKALPKIKRGRKGGKRSKATSQAKS